MCSGRFAIHNLNIIVRYPIQFQIVGPDKFDHFWMVVEGLVVHPRVHLAQPVDQGADTSNTVVAPTQILIT